MGNSKRDGFHVEQVKTGGGTYIEGGVHTGGGDSVFRDKIVYQGPAYPRLNYRSEITHLIEFYTQTFVGREQEWTELAGFARQKAPGYLLVEALPGYGKSALLAYLVHRWETGRWDQPPVPELLYFFIRQEGQRNTSVAFLQAINSQLLETLKLPGGVPTDLSALRGQFSQLWSQALEAANREKPLLLLVDGLDEIATGEVTIAHLLPANLAPYVHVVVASRPNPEPLQQVSLAHPFKKAGMLHLYTFEEDDVRALLQKHGAVEEMAASLAPRVLTMTKGEPLFARFVCQEVADEGESALARLGKNPPAHVEDYFGQQFKHLDALSEGEHTWDILGLLVVALGGMTTDEIAEVLGLGRRQARKALEPIMRFLLGETRLELMHLQLRKVVAEEFSASEQAAYRQKLLDWCRSYEACGWPDETPGYVLAYYARHLVEAEEREALYALIDKRWMDLKSERTYSHRAFAEDVEVAIEVAESEEPTNWVQFIRGCLIYATLGSLATNVPPAALGVLAQVGQVARAQGYAMLMQDAEKRSQACRLIGEALLEQEEREEAIGVLTQALAAAEAVGDKQAKADALREIAQALAKAGERGRAVEAANCALAAAEAIGDEQAKADALSEIAQALAKAGERDRAVEAANRSLAAAEAIGNEVDKALNGIHAVAQAQESDGKGGIGLASRVFAMVEAIGRVTQALFLVGERDRAADVVNRYLAVAETIKSEGIKARGLSKMAQILAKTGEEDRAIDVANRALAAAEATNWAGESAVSNETAVRASQVLRASLDRLKFGWSKGDALREMAQTLAQVGDRDRAVALANRALELVEAISNEREKASALHGLVQVLAQAGDKDGLNRALAVVEAIQHGYPKAFALSGVAQAMVQIGEKDRAADLANRALTVTEEVRQIDESLLKEVAQALDQIGEKDRATDVTNRALEMEDMDRSAQIEILEALRKTLLEGAVSELRGVVQALAQAGDKDRLNRALAVAEKIEGDDAKMYVMSEATRILAQSGDVAGLNHLLMAAEVIKNGSDKANMFSEIAQALAHMGHQKRALLVLRNALVVARSASRERVLNVLKQNAITLAAIDQGQTLWRVYQAVMEVESWWSKRVLSDE